MPAHRRNAGVHRFKDLRGSPRVVEKTGVGIERDRQHAASDVAADGAGIQQFSRRHHRPDANILRQVHIRHDCDPASILRGHA